MDHFFIQLFNLILQSTTQLADKISPYMEFDEKRRGFFLKADAPEEIVKAQKEFHEWMSKHKEC